ncbi:MAG: DUF5318 family protein [Acidobacteria bacterium]|nr:DUF5318 family protein [Acidobacteriota bacterium]
MPTVDYRLARRAHLRAIRMGFLSLTEACDAHPELLRAARFVGEEIREPCPICEKRALRLVLYAYGDHLKRSSGYVRRRAEIAEMRGRVDEFVTYVVEVCMRCSWNHLVQSVTTGRRWAPASGGRAVGE